VAPRPIALVDDDAGVRRALARLLRSAGFVVKTFASAEEFLRDSGGEAPSCLLADLHLSGMSGLELARTLFRAGRPMPVLLMTGGEDPSIGQRPEGAGTVIWLKKPLDAVVLIEALNGAIRPVARAGDPDSPGPNWARVQ
jgi:two-component system, LuxR family, response regulator FixJ